MSKTKIEAIVFDMDGVLIDAKEWHYEALNRALKLFGFTISRYDHLVTYDGLPTRRKLDLLTRERGLSRPLHAFINDLKQIYTTELVHARCKPLFQHEYALSRLKGRGYKMAVASNAIRNSVELMIQKAALRQYFDVVLSNEDVEKPKPDPMIYLEACRRLGIDPKSCLVVEDNQHGIAAATAAGAHVMEVATVFDVTLSKVQRRIQIVESES